MDVDKLEEIFEDEIYQYLPTKDIFFIHNSEKAGEVYNDFLNHFIDSVRDDPNYVSVFPEEARSIACVLHYELYKCCDEGCERCLL